MGLNTWIRDLVRTKLFPFGGTMSTPFDTDEFPVAIANEILAGAHGYRTLEELADLPKLRMLPPMLATVLRHTRPDLTVFPRTTFVLDPSDDIWDPFASNPSYSKISDIPGWDISLFWKELNGVANTEGNAEIESQYADAQDYGRVGDPGMPAFGAPIITNENYQIGKRSDIDGTIIWAEEYDPTIHKYERQRLGSAGKWGIPKLINATSYSLGDYVDNRFIWVDKNEVPTRPPSLINGQSNGEPFGWQDTPAVPGGADYYAYIVAHDLFRITAQKDTFGSLKAEWSTPQKISTDPNLVRYGNQPSSTNFIGLLGEDTPDWRGFFTPGTDTHMATRIDSLSPWRIQNIDNEAGEYVDYIFKEFSLHYEPLEADRPTTSNPFSELLSDYPNNGWKDYPFTPGTNMVLFRSVGRKYNNGQLKPSGWSIPTQSDGKDIIQSIIEPVSESVFKYNAAGIPSPSTIVLKARVYRGDDLVVPDSNIRWYKGNTDPGNEIIKDSIVPPSDNHVISGTLNDTLTISPDGVDGVQLYSIKALLAGEDYYDVITILDVTDGFGIVAVIDSNDGFVYKNSTGSKIFTSVLYENGIEVPTVNYTVQWFLGLDDVTEVTTPHTLTVIADDFTDKEALKLIITYGGNTYTRTETIVDLSDAPAVLIQYSNQNPLPPLLIDQVWTYDETGAYYMRISKDNGVTWGAAIRVRGESAPYNGGFQRSAYISQLTAPTAVGVTGSLLPTGAGWTATPTPPVGLDSIWEVTAFFIKNPATADISLISANWNIDGAWSTAIKKDGKDGAALGVPGVDGKVGWSPEFGTVTVSPTVEVHVIIDWINLGGADPGTKPATGYFVGADGFTTDIASAKNIKGSAGANGVAGTVTGGTKYLQSSYNWGSFTLGSINTPSTGIYGKIYSDITFITPAEATYKIKLEFVTQFTGDGGGQDTVRFIVQRQDLITLVWSTVTGTSPHDFRTDSGSNSTMHMSVIDVNVVPNTMYKYRLIAYNIAGSNSFFANSAGYTVSLIPG